MKLLFDQNLPPRLALRLASVFPGSAHVAALGLGEADDAAIWSYARREGFAIVTKDADFNERSLLYGAPPQVVWIRRGNASVAETEALLHHHAGEIARMEGQPDVAVLVLR